MPFSTTTIYTKERLQACYLHLQLHSVRTWVKIGVFAAQVVVALCLAAWIHFSNALVNILTVALGLLFLFYVFIQLVLPRILINQAQVLVEAITFTFNEQSFTAHFTNTIQGEITSTIPYSALRRVVRTQDDLLYLLVNKKDVYIVDTTAWTDDQRGFVLHMLRQALGDGRIR